MIEGHVIADLGSLTNNDTHAMINKETAADFGPGMNFNPCQQARQLHDCPRQHFQPPAPEPVRQTIGQHHMDRRIKQQDAEHPASSRITVNNCPKFIFQRRKHDLRLVLCYVLDLLIILELITDFQDKRLDNPAIMP